MIKRRTLQSGFSLISRGEPKIWLTGGMLVICLAMIVGLLSLIITQGLATFWPGPVHWLVLSDNQLDIGEPQRREVRTSVDGKANTSTEPSFFYRTANFDITNRHYRWFEPNELSAAGIVAPPWALVLERYAWGRMYALPSRLSRSLQPDPDDDDGKLLERLNDSQALLGELSGELQPLAASEPTVSLEAINSALATRIASVRTESIARSVAQKLADNSGSVQVQLEDSGPWQPLQSADELKKSTAVAARLVVDRPAEILSSMPSLLQQLSSNRSLVEHLMHRIGLLDGHLSEARLVVRQAELDTDRSVLDKLDSVIPLIDGLVQHARTQSRLETLAREADRLLNDSEKSGQLKQLITRYQQETLKPLGEAFQSELDLWQQQFAEEPSQIQQATQNFARVWREIAESKLPLEQEMQKLESQGAGYQLGVLVPTDASQLEITADDVQAWRESKWTDQMKVALAAQALTPVGKPPVLNQLNNAVSTVEFETVEQGLMTLWLIQRDGAAPVCLVPQQRQLNCQEIVRLFPANRLSLFGKFEVYGQRWREFLLDNPREGNTEGGVFPAIWGTIVMTLIMTLAVVPFGVIAALYLREYTRSGPIVSLVRISINNLAGVPSIVYGVFGLAFFCYSMGAFIDGGARNAQFGVLPSNTWYLVLALTVMVGLVAFLFSLMSGGQDRSQAWWKRRLAKIAPAVWLLSLAGVGVLVFKSPFFDGFYEARLPAPTFGKEGLLWASFTLALLTLPVVIVATEEALSAVPNSLREGSLACGASKWQTIYRIVLPHARPGILTGGILAMARGIGEVAPLMLVGALPVAPDLPLDSEFPYFHGSRSFMHLGYQIYWLGFQSQNSEASKPLVFTCTLLLILIVVSLNLSAIILRARLRKRFQGNQF